MSGSHGWTEPGRGSQLQPPGGHAPLFQRAPTGKLAVRYIRNANAGDSGSRVPGIHFPGSQAGGVWGATRELWASKPGRPGRRAAWRRRRAGAEAGRRVCEQRARAAGACGVPGRGPSWGGPRGPGFGWDGVGGRGRGSAVPQWPPGRGRLPTPALRCRRSWLPAAALTPRAPPGASLPPCPEPGARAAGGGGGGRCGPPQGRETASRRADPRRRCSPAGGGRLAGSAAGVPGRRRGSGARGLSAACCGPAPSQRVPSVPCPSSSSVPRPRPLLSQLPGA